MQTECRLKRPVLVGTIAGGGSVALAQLTMMGCQGKVTMMPLLIVAGLGAMTGAVWGTAVKILGKVGYIVGAVVSLGPASLLVVLGLTWYAITPWAAPPPYPGCEVEVVQGATGAWGLFRNQSYTASIPLEDVERYYLEQMSKYCVEEPQTSVPEDCAGYATCWSASCEIRRLWAEQQFTVRAYEVSEKETNVSQWDAWQD